MPRGFRNSDGEASRTKRILCKPKPLVFRHKHPLVDYIDQLRCEHNMSSTEFSLLLGFSQSWWCMKAAQGGWGKRLFEIDKALDLFGYEIKIVKRKENV